MFLINIGTRVLAKTVMSQKVTYIVRSNYQSNIAISFQYENLASILKVEARLDFSNCQKIIHYLFNIHTWELFYWEW